MSFHLYKWSKALKDAKIIWIYLKWFSILIIFRNLVHILMRPARLDSHIECNTMEGKPSCFSFSGQIHCSEQNRALLYVISKWVQDELRMFNNNNTQFVF